jgi:hypothetical protein
VRNPLRSRAAVPDDVRQRAGLGRGARVLASARSADGTWLLGTRDALVVLPGGADRADPAVVPWQRVAAAEWSKDEDRLRVTEVAEFGAVPATRVFTVSEPGLFLQLVRERVTASILLQRWAPVRGRHGLTVIARRPPQGGETTWAVELDPGLAPDDPLVREAADRALGEAQAELGFV